MIGHRARLRQVDSTLRAAHHALAGPVQGILNALFLVRQRGTLGPDDVAIVDQLDRDAGRVTERMARWGILTAALEGPAIASVEAAAIVAAVRGELGDRADRLRVQCAYEGPFSADARLLCLALVELLDNACRFEPAPGPVTLDIRPEGASIAMTVTGGRSTSWPADPDAVLDPLWSERSSSLGLGLSIVSLVAEAHRGRFELTPGRPDQHPTRAELRVPLGEELR